jgi:(p)ppGpp synthase/HD superfamily hydrolase
MECPGRKHGDTRARDRDRGGGPRGAGDKAGAPYILHPLRMMLSVDTPDARMAAVLHDVVEDTPVTLEQLRAEAFPGQ